MQTIRNKLMIFENKLEKIEISFHVTYICILTIFYSLFLVNTHSHSFSIEYSIPKISFSIVLASVIIITLFKNLNHSNHFILLVTTIILFQVTYPELVYYALNNGSVVVPITATLSVLILIVLSKRLKNPDIGSNEVPFKILALITILMSIPFLIYFPYLNLNNLLLREIYETRQVFREVSIPALTYLIAPLTRVLLPIVIVRSIELKRYKLTGLFSVIYLYIFLCGAFKSVFIGIIAIGLFYFGNLKKKRLWFVLLFSVSVGLSMILFRIPVFHTAYNLFRRLLFIPPQMNNYFVDTFINNPTFFSHSGLTFNLINNPYGNLPFYVGETIIGTKGLSANVGLFVEGAVGFSYFGILISTAMIVGIILIFNYLEIPHKYFGIVYIYIYYLNNALISTLLLTHGLFFVIIFFYMSKTINQSTNEIIKKFCSVHQ